MFVPPTPSWLLTEGGGRVSKARVPSPLFAMICNTLEMMQPPPPPLSTRHCLQRRRWCDGVTFRGVRAAYTDIRRKVDELAVRWKMKDPGRADETTEYSAVPLLGSNRDDPDDEVGYLWSNEATTAAAAGSVELTWLFRSLWLGFGLWRLCCC